MKLLNTIVAAVAIVLVAASAFADCSIHPNPGMYSTYAGTVLPGRASEAWCSYPPYEAGFPGNTENAESWNGTALGTQWRVWGMAIDANGAREVARNLVNGTGWIDYTTNYVGGQFWLWGGHLWGDGVNDMTGTITYYNVSTRISYVSGVMVGATSNVYFTGVFDQCPVCTLEYVITNAMFVWRTGMANQPANYPAFLCGATTGEYFDVCCIQASIYCPVATEETTWGAIKSLYE